MKNTKKPIHSLVSLSELEFLLKAPRKQLRDIAKTANKRYNPFDFHKPKTDKWRHIDNPDNSLKILQERILRNILDKQLSSLPKNMTGGVTGKSVVKNAKLHVGKGCVGIIDIKECFPSTKHKTVYGFWRGFFGCGITTAGILTHITTLYDRLPQGAPSSPLICNFILVPIYREIESYTTKHRLSLSIFVDDITISGDKKEVESAIEVIIKILIKYKYSVRNKKIKILTSAYRQKVTGSTVNSKLSLGREEKNEIRKLIIETAKLKGYIPSNTYNKITGKISNAKQLSRGQGVSLENFAEKLLVLPVLAVKAEKKERRKCNSYRRNHKYL